MSLAIVLGGWTAASILLSPLIGRFLAGPQNAGGYGREPCENGLQSSSLTSSLTSSLAGPWHAGTGNMRRNVAAHLHKGDAGWPPAVH